jgi:hypothetical protein
MDFDEIGFMFADLVLAGLGDGLWSALIDDLRFGLAFAGSADPAAVRTAALVYRRERGLLASEDLRSWLAERELVAEDLAAHLRRVVVLASGEAGSAGGQDPSADEIAGSLRAEAVLSGALQSCGLLLANWAAAARARGTLYELPTAPADGLIELARADAVSALDALAGDDLDARARRVAALKAEYDAFAVEVADEEAIERLLRRHRLDWQRYRFRQAVFEQEPAAREAALCVRQDGMSLEEVAELARVTVIECTQRLDEAGKHMNGVLLAAAPGELAGPYPHEDGFILVEVLERSMPDLNDHALTTRARTELVAEALERHLVGRTHWHVAV